MKRFAGLILIMFLSFLVSLKGLCIDVEKNYIQEGEYLLQKYERNETPELNSMYLQSALYNYYVATKKDSFSVEALIGLGRVYMALDMLNEAKNVLFKAYSYDKNNPDTNFYFAQYNYKISEYKTALKYYKRAKKFGYKDVITLEEKLIKCYDKLGEEDIIE